MSKKVTRRDFLNGIAIGAGATTIALSPFSRLALATGAEGVEGITQKGAVTYFYPPAEMGLRGNAPGTFSAAHQLMRGEEEFKLPAKDEISEEYDLVIVGAGISGLAAAYFYREQHGNDKKILLLDNSDDFGGHAVRNEFTTDKGLLIGYGGSESFQSPRSVFSDIASKLIQDLKIDIDHLEDSFDVNLYPNMGLSKAIFFDKEHWGVNKIVAGDPGFEVADDIPRDRLNGRPYAEFIADFPLSKIDQEALIALFEERVDHLNDLTLEEKLTYLDKTSYLNFLMHKVKLSPDAIKFFQQQTSEFLGVGIDAAACSDARLCALPGFEKMGLPSMDAESEAELNDPYLFHFPDGNATLARMIVRRLIPAVAPGNTMDDIVLSKFDYSQLDIAGSPTRLRLNATVINAENRGDNSADVIYATEDKLYRINATNVIMANYNMMIPYMVPTMPEAQREALAQNIKAPLVYAKVVINNWQAFHDLGIHKIHSPTAPFCLTKLDYPVSIGGYKHPKTPDQPICIHMVYVPILAGSGKSSREQSIEGRKKIVKMDFAEYELMIRNQLHDMLGEHGFNHEEDIMGITVNRWGHGYSYDLNTLFDDEDEAEKTIKTARQPFGRIFIANSDSNWGPYAHEAIDAAHRAVSEIKS